MERSEVIGATEKPQQDIQWNDWTKAQRGDAKWTKGLGTTGATGSPFAVTHIHSGDRK